MLLLTTQILKRQNSMLTRLIEHRFTYFMFNLKCSLASQSSVNLGKQMKILNDKKQFEKTLILFDSYKEKNFEQDSGLIFTQALKACTQIGDLKRGLNIYHQISPSIKNDNYILTSLIHLYSNRNLIHFFFL